jgi:hypothetical protein
MILFHPLSCPVLLTATAGKIGRYKKSSAVNQILGDDSPTRRHLSGEELL